ncbi:hypothetical protein [Devosia sp. Leaf64]|uniref:hypothetical protein n=1 Tax=Devosia sp. Leaf64 TaxID=1736229 RepID=UPI000715EA29|nr:hypothetical protein [Devosia sp. Leaf64]KQN75080.1 hypothetical protein ASE94_01815 [Devosia sp. Leaf64]
MREKDRSACGIDTLKIIAAGIESGVLDQTSEEDSGVHRHRNNPYDRDPIAQAVKDELFRTVAQQVRLTPTAEIQAVLPNLGKRQLTNLRNERPNLFGWDRLNTIAIRLGIDVTAIWSKHYQPQQVAA